RSRSRSCQTSGRVGAPELSRVLLRVSYRAFRLRPGKGGAIERIAAAGASSCLLPRRCWPPQSRMSLTVLGLEPVKATLLERQWMKRVPALVPWLSHNRCHNRAVLDSRHLVLWQFKVAGSREQVSG